MKSNGLLISSLGVATDALGLVKTLQYKDKPWSTDQTLQQRP